VQFFLISFIFPFLKVKLPIEPLLVQPFIISIGLEPPPQLFSSFQFIIYVIIFFLRAFMYVFALIIQILILILTLVPLALISANFPFPVVLTTSAVHFP
jgi:hypothetical protein